MIIRFIGLRIALPALIFAAAADAQPARALEAGDRAPMFSITTDQGKHIGPNTPGRGLLVLNFWETSCVPCVAELPSLSAFAARFASDPVVVVAVSEDEDAQKYSRFLHDRHVILETYRDPARRISKSFGTLQFPETYLIQNGRIVRKVVGGIDWMNDQISSFVHKLVAP